MREVAAFSTTSRRRLLQARRGLLISVLAGYPDRVARRRRSAGEARQDKKKKKKKKELLLSGGERATLAPESVVRKAEFLVAVDAGERRVAGGGRSGRGGVTVRLASAIEPDWLLDLFADALAEQTEARWNAQSERVEVVTRLVYDRLVLDESRPRGDAGREEAARMLAERALAARWNRVRRAREPVERFLARVEFMSRTFPEKRVPATRRRRCKRKPRAPPCAKGGAASRSYAKRRPRGAC